MFFFSFKNYHLSAHYAPGPMLLTLLRKWICPYKSLSFVIKDVIKERSAIEMFLI